MLKTMDMNVSPSTMTRTMKYSSRVQQHNNSKKESSISDLFSSQLKFHYSRDYSLAESLRLEFPEISWVDDNNAPLNSHMCQEEEEASNGAIEVLGTGNLSCPRRKDVEGSQNHHKHMCRSLAVRNNLASLKDDASENVLQYYIKR